ncbi:MAG TPA: ester cyclase [Methylomirabilota bacterium]|jgi:steroid delta-isomerase-like uncharacterized protein|nr:ester cyclase [Methylomirabilota bacterium]
MARRAATRANPAAHRLKTIRDHIRQESTQDIDGLLAGMTKDCSTIVMCAPRPYIGPKAVERRYREQWTGFPDFKVRIRRIIAMGPKYAVTENEWTGTHLGPFMGREPTGKRVRVRTAVIWEFRGDKLRGEYIYFDLATVLRQMGALPR